MERVLVLTPTGRDAAMVRERILADGIPCEVCGDLPALLAGIASGAGAAVVAQEALARGGSAETLLAALEAQESWSDIPLLLLTDSRSRRGGGGRVLPMAAVLERANVTLLERPLKLRWFLSGVRSAVRARRRQYEMRDLLRALERAVETSDTFVGILGHDLRTPINAIKLSAETIVRLSTDTRALRPASRILSSSDRMARMIEQLLDFARVRQGRGIPLRPRDAHLGELCRQVVQELEDANPQAVVQVEESGDLAGRWDPDRLAQVVSNLVGNAVQHGAPGEPIGVEAEGAERSVVRLRVRSHGPIRADALPTLFEGFRRAGRTADSGSRTGLGLGLFIAREIARAHGGDLLVNAESDRTTFEATLPRTAPERNA